MKPDTASNSFGMSVSIACHRIATSTPKYSCEDVPKFSHLSPRDLRMSGDEVIVDVSGRLANHFEVPNDCVHRLQVEAKRVERQAGDIGANPAGGFKDVLEAQPSRPRRHAQPHAEFAPATAA